MQIRKLFKMHVQWNGLATRWSDWFPGDIVWGFSNIIRICFKRFIRFIYIYIFIYAFLSIYIHIYSYIYIYIHLYIFFFYWSFLIQVLWQKHVLYAKMLSCPKPFANTLQWRLMLYLQAMEVFISEPPVSDDCGRKWKNMEQISNKGMHTNKTTGKENERKRKNVVEYQYH